jgi:hypothetical protein
MNIFVEKAVVGENFDLGFTKTMPTNEEIAKISAVLSSGFYTVIKLNENEK